ncbi:MAG: TonB-dependent receptor, partial [Bacteroidia bacterium]
MNLLFRSTSVTKSLTTFLFLLHFFYVSAQPQNSAAKGNISGKIIDSISGQAIEYATISLVTENDNKIVNGTTSDNNGVFQITDIEFGSYKMQLYFIGYQIKTERSLIISKEKPDLQLGAIKLANTKTNLKEVTVTAEKNIIENKIDKLVYNVDKDVTSQSGVAADVLKKVPQVSVDVDGNVELQGSSSIRFLINGKPSIIFGNNIADVLQSIPANQIQSIEVITSPGAKYDASGTGGIINIILKKSTAEGYNGNISLSGGTRLENGSVNLNIHHGHFGANAFVSGNAQLPSTTLNNMQRTSQGDSLNGSNDLLQNGTSQFSRKGFESGVGIDWEINSKNNITGSLGFDYFDNNNTGVNDRQSVTRDSYGNELSNVNDRATTTNSFNSHSFDWGLNYKKTFKKEDQELEIACQSSNGTNYSHYNQRQKFISPDSVYSGSYANNPGVEKETDISIDYTQPLGKDATLEMGAKTVINNIISTSDVYLLNTPSDNYNYSSNQSSSLNYKSYVYAGYISGTFKLFGWLDVKTGLRYEYTEPHAYFSNAGTVLVKPYGTYV